MMMMMTMMVMLFAACIVEFCKPAFDIKKWHAANVSLQHHAMALCYCVA